MKYLLIIAVSLLCGFYLGSHAYINELRDYKFYHRATENLLDTLENEYGWVDAIDNYDYYEALDKLHN
jgi:hypothetical protein